MQIARERIITCDTCGNIDTISPCTLCADARRDHALLIVVEDVADLWALERAEAARGRYHVLGGVLSALDGVGPKDLNLDRLVARVAEGKIREVINIEANAIVILDVVCGSVGEEDTPLLYHHRAYASTSGPLTEPKS